MMPSTNVQDVRKFITFAAQKLQLPSLPNIKLVGSQENRYNAFGHSKGNVIIVRITERHPIDIMRTLAHELIHYKQNVLGIRTSENSKEDQANLLAGRLMRDFDIANPQVFKDPAIRANMLHESVISGVGGNTIGSGNIATYDPVMGMQDKRRKQGEYGLKNLFHKRVKPEKPLHQIVNKERQLDKG